MDGAILFSDILILPWALGRDLTFTEGHGPRLTPLRAVDEVMALDLSGFPDRVAPVLETIGLIRSELAQKHPDTALIGFVGSPFTVADLPFHGMSRYPYPMSEHYPIDKQTLQDELEWNDRFDSGHEVQRYGFHYVAKPAQ